MAHGTLCKMRLATGSDAVQLIKTANSTLKDLVQSVASTRIKLLSVIYAGTFSNGYAEISAPNAVFDGTSVSVPLGIVSADAKDTAAGVGVKTIKLITLGSNDKLELITITMGGATVITEDSFPKRILHAYMATVGTENDAAGNITIYRRAFDSMTDIAATSSAADSGLTAATPYYWKVNTDAGGVTEYTITTGTDVTWAAVLILMNAEMASEAATATITDGYLRITSDAGTSVATTAGSTGTDLLATAGGTTAANTAKEDYLQIGAAANESEGAAIFCPNGAIVTMESLYLVMTSSANANAAILVKHAAINVDDAGADPDLMYMEHRAVISSGGIMDMEPGLHSCQTGAKITFSETYKGAAEDGQTILHTLVIEDA